MAVQNRLQKLVYYARRLPAPIRRKLMSQVLGRVVPMVGTAHIEYLEVSSEQVVVRLDNHKVMQNHIKGIHAAAMALLAETATGFVTALNLSDDQIVLLKSMKVSYLTVAQGSLTATATLDAIQQHFIQSHPKGRLAIPVYVTDETGNQPIECEMIWAWLPKATH